MKHGLRDLKILSLLAIVSVAPHAQSYALDMPTLADPFFTQSKITPYGKNLKPVTCPAPPDVSKPLTLHDVITAALCHNPDARAAYLSLLANADSYDGTLVTSYLSDITIGSEIAAGASRQEGVITHTPLDNSGVGISTTATLFDFGRQARALERAERGLISAGLGYDQALQGYIVSSLNSYFSLLSAQNSLAIAEESLALAKYTRDVAETNYSLGRIALPDVLEARTSFANEELSLQRATYDLQNSRAALAFLIGFPPLTEVRVTDLDDASLMTPPFKDSLLALIEKAKAQNISLKRTRIDLKNAEESLKDTRRRHLPTVSATVGRRYGDWDVSNLSNKPIDSATINVSVPIFTGFSRIFNERAEVKNLEATRIGVVQQERGLERDVLSAWQAYNSARRSYEIVHASLATARLRQELELQRYKEGLNSMIQLTSAQISYRNARQNDILTRNALLSARIALVQIVGSLDLSAIEPLTQTTPALAPVVQYKDPFQTSEVTLDATIEPVP